LLLRNAQKRNIKTKSEGSASGKKKREAPMPDDLFYVLSRFLLLFELHELRVKLPLLKNVQKRDKKTGNKNKK
jgi:hypothetical protein